MIPARGPGIGSPVLALEERVTRITAAELEALLRNVSANLDKSIRIVKEGESEEEFVRYRKLVGRMMGEIFTEVLQPIYSQFPDLAPEALRPNIKR